MQQTPVHNLRASDNIACMQYNDFLNGQNWKAKCRKPNEGYRKCKLKISTELLYT